MKSPPQILLPLTLAALAGCAATPDGALEAARSSYERASGSADVQAHAPELLAQAQERLRQAEEADREADREHLAYLTDRYSELALLESERERTEAEIERLAALRERLQLASAQGRAERAEQRLEMLQSELAALEAQRTERGWLMTLDDVLFATGRAEVRPGASRSLENLVDFLRAHPETAVRVEGHTDSTGSEQLNQRLSQQRAEAVRRAIIAQGIEPERVEARGYGESRPVAPNQTAAGRQLNRRVEVLIQAGDAAG